MRLKLEEVKMFQMTGLLHKKGLVEKSALSKAKSHIINELKRSGVVADGKWHIKQFKDTPTFQLAGKISQKVTMTPALADLFTSDLSAMVNELGGARFTDKVAPQPLITPPQGMKWSPPEHGWHVDVAAKPPTKIPGIQIFILLADSPAQGGATCVIPHNHETFVELCGKGGDVYFMDMRLKHAPSINSAKHARLMITKRYLAESLD